MPSKRKRQKQGKVEKQEKEAEPKPEQQISDEEDDEEDEGSADEGISLEAEEGQEKIDVEFTFFDPREADWWSVKEYLKDYLDSATFDPSPIAKAIANQVAVGTMIKSGEGDSQPLGFLSVLNMAEHKEILQPVVKYILGKCKEAQLHDKLKVILSDPHTGLILSGRMINTPSELVPPLHEAVLQDIAWARQNGEADDKRHSNYKQFVLLARHFSSHSPSSSSSSSSSSCSSSSTTNPSQKKKQKKKKQKTEKEGLGEKEGYYRYFEEECYAKVASLQFSFKLAGGQAAVAGGEGEDVAAAQAAQKRGGPPHETAFCSVLVVPETKAAQVVSNIAMMLVEAD